MTYPNDMVMYTMRFLIFTFLVGCGGTWVSPLDAYRMESAPCGNLAGDDARKCHSMVDKKYGRYLHEGGYPAPPNSTAYPGPTVPR